MVGSPVGCHKCSPSVEYRVSDWTRWLHGWFSPPLTSLQIRLSPRIRNSGHPHICGVTSPSLAGFELPYATWPIINIDCCTSLQVVGIIKGARAETNQGTTTLIGRYAAKLKKPRSTHVRHRCLAGVWRCNMQRRVSLYQDVTARRPRSGHAAQSHALTGFTKDATELSVRCPRHNASYPRRQANAFNGARLGNEYGISVSASLHVRDEGCAETSPSRNVNIS